MSGIGPAAEACAACGNTNSNTTHVAREMMFGTREAFTYLQCGACGTWWLPVVPEKMASHYPPEYYSFGAARIGAGRVVKHYLNRPVLALYLHSRITAGFLRSMRRLPESVHVLSGLGISPRSRIIDVGSGRGRYVVKLYGLGFCSLLGIDKFIDADLDLGHGVLVRRAEAREIHETFDVVMSHHSFEHVPGPDDAFEDLARLVAPGGALVIRTPNAASWAARNYGVDWFALDPPRHVVVYTPEGIGQLAERHGFRVEAVSYDSEPEELIYSEQYRRGIAYNADNSHARKGLAGPFTRDEIDEFARRTRQLNASSDAGYMCIVLRRASGT